MYRLPPCAQADFSPIPNGEWIDTPLVLPAMDMALLQRGRPCRLPFHTDSGAQHVATDLRAASVQARSQISTSSKPFTTSSASKTASTSATQPTSNSKTLNQ